MANNSVLQNTVSTSRNSESGFTLIETALSLVILMVVGLGAASLFAYATRNNSAANDRELAMAVAQKRLEWLRNIPFSATTRGVGYSYPDGGLAETGPDGVTETVIGSGRSYVVRTVIIDTATVPAGDPDAFQPTLKTISVTVTPQGADTPLGSLTLTTQRSTLVPGRY